MREWLVIEDSRKNTMFGPRDTVTGYIPRDVAEVLLGKRLTGMTWFTKDESEKMRAAPEWRDTEPTWTPLGFWL